MTHRSRTRRSLSRCARAARSCARPRWIRLRTVPSFTPMVAAISLRKAFDVAEHYRGPVVRGQRLQCRLDVSVEVAVVPCLRRRLLGAWDPLLDVVAESLKPDPLPAPRTVKEEVGGDPVQPAFECPRRIGGQGAENPDEDFLSQVLRVMLVAGKAVGKPVNPGRMRAHDLVPAGRHPLSCGIATFMPGNRRLCHQVEALAHRLT